jgi:hypothetical protein
MNQNTPVINKNECCGIIEAFVSTAAQGFSKNIQYLVLTRNQHTHIMEQIAGWHFYLKK